MLSLALSEANGAGKHLQTRSPTNRVRDSSGVGTGVAGMRGGDACVVLAPHCPCPRSTRLVVEPLEIIQNCTYAKYGIIGVVFGYDILDRISEVYTHSYPWRNA